MPVRRRSSWSVSISPPSSLRVPRERITHVFLTPTLWRRLLDADLAGIDFSSVRQVGFAAEAMDATTLARLRARISPNVVQMYGATETGAAATCIFAEEMVGERLASVGRPMLNGDLRIVVPGGGPDDEVANGETGEILVSSPSLAAGIFDDPAMTAARFIVDGERRWWRSRDLGRVDRDGYLFIEGRHDDMIISGGINIMPARVEEALLGHPGVAGVRRRRHSRRGMGRAGLGLRGCLGSRRSMPTRSTGMSRKSGLSSYQRPRALRFRGRTAAHGDQQSEPQDPPPAGYRGEVFRCQINRTGQIMNDSETVLLSERRGSIAVLTLNRPAKRNALSERLWERLKEAFETLDRDVRAVVLRGAGPHFCAGLDLAEHKRREPFRSIAMSRFAHATLDAIQFGGAR